MSTAEQSPLTSDELKLLESLLFCANERELSRLTELLGPTVTVTLPTATENRTATADEWQALIAANLRKYCPHEPWPKQRFLLDLDCTEIMFGGSKGPGKTEALLRAPLRYVHVPGYSCLILRRSTKEAKQANSILDRLYQWTVNHREVKWNLSDSSVRFPSGAIIKFGYIDSPMDVYQFQSSEYTTIIFDELTDFRISEGEGDLYKFMFGMNRKPRVGSHPWLAQVPCQILSGTNPGGRCHRYVKDRFLTPESIAWVKARVEQRARDKASGAETVEPPPKAFASAYDETGKPVRAYVPALIYDNPSIDADEYIKTRLGHLPEVTRLRFINGDWSVQEYGLIQSSQFRYWTNRGPYLIPLDRDKQPFVTEMDEGRMVRFITVDTAGTSKQKADEMKGKPPSWSVAGVWDYDRRTRFLFLRHIWRERVGFIDLCNGVASVIREWNPHVTFVENAHHGGPVVETLRGTFNIQVTPTKTEDMKGEDGAPGKIGRATPLFRKLAAGEIFFPLYNNSWLRELEAELLSWTGLEEETADQIDVCSYACAHAEGTSGVSGEGMGGNGVLIVPYFAGVGRVDLVPNMPAGIGGWR